MRRIACLALLAAGCSSSDGAPDEHPPDAAIADAAPGDEKLDRLVCPVEASEELSGYCHGAGSCVTQVKYMCRPGVTMVPGSPTVFECSCPDEIWHCTVIGGGFSLVPCPGYDAGSE